MSPPTPSTSTHTFPATDLFDIEDWVRAYTASRPSIIPNWMWSWHMADGFEDDISKMADWLCDVGVDVEGEVRVEVERDAGGRECGFRVVVGGEGMVVAVGSRVGDLL